MSDTNTAPATPANGASDDEHAEHTLAATLTLAKEIRDVLDEAQVGEDVWSGVAISSKSTAPDKAAASFTLEGEDGLYYTVTVAPKPE